MERERKREEKDKVPTERDPKLIKEDEEEEKRMLTYKNYCVCRLSLSLSSVVKMVLMVLKKQVRVVSTKITHHFPRVAVGCSFVRSFDGRTTTTTT